ncbi:acyltransferase family protein [Agrobacterium deltaense]
METASTDKLRFLMLDFYRFLAAIGVVLFHVNSIDSRAKSVIDVGSFGIFVDFFFMLSGFVLFHNYKDLQLGVASYSTFLVRRLARIYPLHIATMAVLICMSVVLPLPTSTVKYLDIVLNTFLVQAWGLADKLTLNHPSWSISAEFFCYLLFPFIMVMIRSVKIYVSAPLVLIVFYIFSRPSLPVWEQPGGMYGANYDFGMLRALPSFLLGCLTYKIYQQVRISSSLFLYLGIATFLLAAWWMFRLSNPNHIMVLLAFSMLSTALGERSISYSGKTASILSRAGDCSYAIYMIHGILFATLFKFVWQALGEPIDFLLPYLSVTIVSLTFMGYVVFRGFEKPARNFINSSLAPQPSLRMAN